MAEKQVVDSVEPGRVGIGPSAFGSLRAEDEPWLDRCLIYPPRLDRFAGPRSAMIFGEPGSGKTTLFHILESRLRAAQRPGSGPCHLLVPWLPGAGKLDESALLSHLLGRCAQHLALHLAGTPDLALTLPLDIQRTLAWFIGLCPADSGVPYLGSRPPDGYDTAIHTLRPWLESMPAEHWLASQRSAIVVNELVKAIRYVGLESIHILVSPEVLDESEELQEELRVLLSSTTLFENSRFLYKLILPISLEAPLARTGAAVRRRIDVYHLKWGTEQLVQIVLRRLSLAAGRPIASLGEVCADAKLRIWLERTGGLSPRGWLRYFTPLADRYLQVGQVIPAKEWHTLRAEEPPPLFFDEDTQSVTVGMCTIPALPEVPLALLSFLWQQRPRVCNRRELYERAYVKAMYPDQPTGDSRPLPLDYEHLLDTAILRLREKIEPDPRSPLYVTTVRGQGYKLEHAW